MQTNAKTTLPRIAADLPPAMGRLKVEPEDFRVEEILDAPFDGQGEHLCLMVEKRDLAHERMLELLSRHTGVSEKLDRLSRGAWRGGLRDGAHLFHYIRRQRLRIARNSHQRESKEASHGLEHCGLQPRPEILTLTSQTRG